MIKKGILFGNVHSYNDLGLILSNIIIPPAVPKTNYIDVPGGDGSIDFTEANGEVKYSDRECSFIFTMSPLGEMSESAWEEKKKEVSNALNGLKCNITLDKDNGYYYFGRCVVNEYLSDRGLKQIVISARVHPYKYKKDITVINQELAEIQQEMVITNGRKTVVPEIICTNDNTNIVFGQVEKELSAGTHKILDFQLKSGENKFLVSGNGTISFKYQEAEL